MTRIVFGVWGDRVIDNRNKRPFEIEEEKELDGIDVFGENKYLKAFIGWKGFFIFEPSVNLVDAARQYMERVVKESCGKCTPCRVGTRVILKKLEAILNGEADKETLDELEKLADHVKRTSKCGLGQTSTVALLLMLKYFRDEFEKVIESGGSDVRQPSYSYVTAPCIEACPARVEVPKYIDYIRDGKFAHAVGVVLTKYPWAATCGRVCVRFCEFACRRTLVDEAVGIKLLKRFVADRERYVRDKWFSKALIDEFQPPDLKVAVVGSGPAGISAAYHLLLKGYHVDVFEAMTEPGGMAAVGIPNYRLPKDILKMEVSIIEMLGGRIFYNKRLGVDFKLKDLFDQGYRAVFLGIGAQKGKQLGIPGEDRKLKGYKTGVSFLLYINHYYINMGLEVDIGEKVVVVGGGNVAMDCVRSALRLGAKEVHLVYRRSREQMPADPEEVRAAEEEGVIFHFLTNPTRILAENGRVVGIELIRMKLGEPDESGRARPIPIEGSEFVLETDMVIPAIGQTVDAKYLQGEDIEFTRWGTIKVNPDTYMTTRRGVFAGGDATRGPGTLIEAMADGMMAANRIDQYLRHGRIRVPAEERMSRILSVIRKHDKEEIKVPVKLQRKVKVEELDPKVRKAMFEEVEKPISVEEAYREAERCLRCYRVSLAIFEDEEGY